MGLKLKGTNHANDKFYINKLIKTPDFLF